MSLKQKFEEIEKDTIYQLKYANRNSLNKDANLLILVKAVSASLKVFGEYLEKA